jgi:hypothetical protein
MSKDVIAEKRRPGRPRKPSMVFWGVRLDTETVEAIRDAARLSNTTQGEIIKAALKGLPRQ